MSLRQLLGAALIAAVSLAAYLPSLGGGFILDDDLLVTDNPLVADSHGLYRIWCTTEPVDYWPVTNTSFWIEWRLWGMNPTGYHVTNLVLHIASALLIWAILNKLSIPGGWLAALLFAIHPVNVESVAWIAQRKNTLSMLFFLLSILWYLKTDRGVGRWYALSLLAFTLAMLSKGSVAILPLELLLIAWWQRGSITKQDLVRTAPYFLIALMLTVVNVWFQTHGSNIEARSAGFIERSLGAGAVVWFYLYKALVPVNLLFVYPQWNVESTDWRWWAPFGAAICVTALLVWQRNTRFGRPLLFAWLFFCIALLPVMGFTDVGFMQYTLVADHYLHIAVIGVVTLVAAGVSRLIQACQIQVRSAVVAATALVVGALAFQARQQSSLYADAITLYATTLVQNPDCWLVRTNLGATLNRTGRHQEAIEQLEQALLLKPDLAEAENDLAIALRKLGRSIEAIEHLERAVQLRPDYPDAQYNLANALKQVGQFQKAIEHYQNALRLRPDFAKAHNNLGIALLNAGRLQDAIAHFEQARRLKPENVAAQFNLAAAYAKAGNLSDAVTTAQLALQLARSSGQSQMADRIEQQLRKYRAGKVDQPGTSSQFESP